MTQILKDELATYLGELMHVHENEHDYQLKYAVALKISAVHVLLAIESEAPKHWYDKLKNSLKK